MAALVRSWRYRGVVLIAMLIVVISTFNSATSLTSTVQMVEAAWVAVGVISLAVHVRESVSSWREWRAVRDEADSRDPYVQAQIVIATGHYAREVLRTCGQFSFMLAGALGMAFTPQGMPAWLGRLTLIMLHVGQIVWLLTAASEASERDELSSIRDRHLRRLDERTEDWARHDSGTAFSTAATDRLEAKADDAARALDVIHTLVNSRLTAALKAQMVALQSQLEVLRGVSDSETTAKTIAIVESQIAELAATLASREQTDEDVASSEEP